MHISSAQRRAQFEAGLQPLVVVDGDLMVTDSRMVARKFGKSHSVVLRAFDNLRCSDNFRRCNFASSNYLNAQGKTQRSVTMTKDGFVMLAMGFTGKEAMRFKEDYINAFNAMADHIANTEKNLWQKMQALISREVASEVRASFGSRLMTDRKRELPSLSEERAELENQLQPSLLQH